MCLNAFPLISGHSPIRHPPLHAHKGVRLQGARASCASSVLPGSWWDLSLIRRASPLQHIRSNTDPHLAFIVTWLKIVSILLPPIKNIPARQHKYISSYVRLVLGPFRRGSLDMICCSNQHAYFWKKTPPRIFQNLSWVSLFFIFDLKNVNISHDIFDIL